MNPKKLTEDKLIGAIYLGLLTSLILVVVIIGKIAVTNKVVAPSKNKAVITTPTQTIFGPPVRLRIPSIGVDAAVENVGLTSDGSMEAPKNQDNVAWYQSGIRPGNVGSAVMAGHYGTWDNGRGSVFDNLSKLAKGDKVVVVDDRGQTTTFVVREIQVYDPQADATRVFISNDGKSHLNLITCKGNLNILSQKYPERLVIFSDKE